MIATTLHSKGKTQAAFELINELITLLPGREPAAGLRHITHYMGFSREGV